MKTKIILLTVLLLGCLFSCLPEKIDVKVLSSSDTILNIENRLHLSIGDTCVVEEHWFNYFDGAYHPISYTVLTKEESEKRLKTQFALFMLGKEDKPKGASEGFVYQNAVVISKY